MLRRLQSYRRPASSSRPEVTKRHSWRGVWTSPPGRLLSQVPPALIKTLIRGTPLLRIGGSEGIQHLHGVYDPFAEAADRCHHRRGLSTSELPTSRSALTTQALAADGRGPPVSTDGRDHLYHLVRTMCEVLCKVILVDPCCSVSLGAKLLAERVWPSALTTTGHLRQLGLDITCACLIINL